MSTTSTCLHEVCYCDMYDGLVEMSALHLTSDRMLLFNIIYISIARHTSAVLSTSLTCWPWKCRVRSSSMRVVITVYILGKGKKGKGRYSSSWEPHLRATGRHLPYGITQCYLPLDTSESTRPNPSHAGWYSIYLPRRDGRLSWPTWLDSAPAGSRTSDLSITSPSPNHCTTKTAWKPHILCVFALQLLDSHLLFCQHLKAYLSSYWLAK